MKSVLAGIAGLLLIGLAQVLVGRFVGHFVSVRDLVAIFQSDSVSYEARHLSLPHVPMQVKERGDALACSVSDLATLAFQNYGRRKPILVMNDAGLYWIDGKAFVDELKVFKRALGTVYPSKSDPMQLRTFIRYERLWNEQHYKFSRFTEFDRYNLIPSSEKPQWLEDETRAMDVYTRLCAIAGTCAKSRLSPMPGVVRRYIFHDRRDQLGMALFLSGTEFQRGTGIVTDVLAAFNRPNLYFNRVKSVLLDHPTLFKNKSLLIVGHSLGGMIGEQISMDGDIRDRLTRRITLITFGSPIISGFDPNKLGPGGYAFFNAQDDFVPDVSKGLPYEVRQNLDASTALHLTYPFLYRDQNFPWEYSLPVCLKYSNAVALSL